MKNVKLTSIVLLLVCTLSIELIAQKTEVIIGTPVTITASPPTTSCDGGATNCTGLVTEYFVVDLSTAVSSGGNLIVGSSESNIIDPTIYGLGIGDCFAITPICYELSAIQDLIDGMITNPFPFASCCGAVNDATPVGVTPLICDAITAIYMSGNEVMNLEDVRIIFSAFGNDSLTVATFISTAEQVNLESTGLNLICGNPGLPISYCVSPTDSIPFIIVNEPVVALEQIVLQGNPTPVGNALQWKVELDQAARIHLERSLDGRNFSTINSIFWDYTDGEEGYLDTDILQETLFYRLSIEPIEGTKLFSNIISLRNPHLTMQVMLESTLVRDILRLNSNTTELESIIIYNSEGRKVFSNLAETSEIDVSFLHPGIYFFQVNSRLNSNTVKFLKI